MRRYLLLTLLFATTTYGYAQIDSIADQAPRIKSASVSRFLIKAYGGFGFMSPGSYRIQSKNTVSLRDALNNPYDTLIQTQGRKGIGGGWRYGGGIGYVVNDFWSVGVDLEYQKSQKMTNSLTTKLGTYDFDSTADEMHYKAMTVTPYITFRAVSKPRYFIYNRIGVLFTLPFTLHTSGNAASARSNNWPPGPSSDTSTASLSVTQKSNINEYKLSLGVGFNLALGVNWRLTNHLRIFAEFFGNFSALRPERSVIRTISAGQYSYYSAVYDYNVFPAEVIRYDPAGRSDIYNETLTTKYQNGGTLETKQESYNYNPTTNTLSVSYSDRNQRFHINMNSIGLNCGVQLRL